MDWYIGIDLGTSALKGLLVNEVGEICGEASAEYPVSYPRPGWSEQITIDHVLSQHKRKEPVFPRALPLWIQ